jgi:hypothetical protein
MRMDHLSSERLLKFAILRPNQSPKFLSKPKLPKINNLLTLRIIKIISFNQT